MEGVNIEILSAGESTATSGMADDVKTSIDDILHGPENTPVDQGRTTQSVGERVSDVVPVPRKEFEEVKQQNVPILRNLANRERETRADENPDQSDSDVSDSGDENRGNLDPNKPTRPHSLKRKHVPDQKTEPDVDVNCQTNQMLNQTMPVPVSAHDA